MQVVLSLNGQVPLSFCSVYLYLICDLCDVSIKLQAIVCWSTGGKKSSKTAEIRVVFSAHGNK